MFYMFHSPCEAALPPYFCRSLCFDVSIRFSLILIERRVQGRCLVRIWCRWGSAWMRWKRLGRWARRTCSGWRRRCTRCARSPTCSPTSARSAVLLSILHTTSCCPSFVLSLPDAIYQSPPRLALRRCDFIPEDEREVVYLTKRRAVTQNRS